jgi:hypothetical protein
LIVRFADQHIKGQRQEKIHDDSLPRIAYRLLPELDHIAIFLGAPNQVGPPKAIITVVVA